MDESGFDEIGTALAKRVAREAAQGLGKKWRCPPDLREEIVTYAVASRKAGETQATISERLGLIESTLARWLRRRKKKDQTMRGFRSVAIVPSDEIQRSTCDQRLRLITADGNVIEGLDLESAVYLLKAIR